MMFVQKFLKEHGLEKLQEQYAIGVTDYPDRVVLNYSQIDSPRFINVVDECRALILRKGTWEVMARSFDRFYNLGEGTDPKYGIGTQRVAMQEIGEDNQGFCVFDLKSSIIQEKLDGSLLSLYWDGNEWCVSTRKKAFAEGKTNLGRTFKEVFMDAASKTNIFKYLDENPACKYFTFAFELTGPENRVVTPYTENKLVLIGMRSNKEEDDYRELTSAALLVLSKAGGLEVARPKEYEISSFEELLALVEAFPTMEEGVVMLKQRLLFSGSHWRIKCKNPKYVAVAHLRENGGVSPKNVLKLVMMNEHHEYLKYFPEDEKYFTFVEEIYSDIKKRIVDIYEECKDIVEQKEFALTMMPKTKFSFEQGIIFSLRKGDELESLLKDVGAKKLSNGINLKKIFLKEFHLVIEDGDEQEKV